MPPYHQFLDRHHPEGYRKAEIEQLALAVRARENRLLLALPGMGLSNLLRFFVSQPQWSVPGETAVSYINLNALQDDPNALFAEIARQLAEQQVGNGLETTADGYQQLYQLLLAANRQAWWRLVIVIDQADGLLTAVSAPFYRQLKALTDLQKHTCILLAASWRFASHVDPENLLFAGRRLFVKPFSVADFAHALTEEAQRLGTTFSENDCRQLTWLTGRHPGLLRAISTAVVLGGVKVADGETAVVQLLQRDDVTYRCQKMWQELTPRQKQDLQQLQELDEVSEQLCQMGLVVEGKNGRWQLFSPVFKQFVATKKPALLPIRIVEQATRQVGEQTIVVAGKVFKGDTQIPVSPLELRLIACLKQEKRIYSKDEIAAYVYYEEWDNYRDISNNRIENLIRQVRRKLGNDYIRAYWGQGYELMA